MVLAGLTNVGAAIGVFGRIKVAEVLELVIFLHVTEDRLTLPVGSFKIAVFGALFGNLDFAVDIGKLSIDFLLALWADAFCFAHINHPTMASTIRARGSNIIDIVTIRSYLRMLATVDADVNNLIAE